MRTSRCKSWSAAATGPSVFRIRSSLRSGCRKTCCSPVTDLFVTNVGYGGMMAALSHGVPVLAVPPSTEKWVGAGNMVNSGPGLRLQVKEAAPGVMKRRVGTLLTDPTFRAAARRVAHAMDRAGGAERAAELCETIARP
ncbi:nucleotide disphospho-sugar-binding domain-containing protein [Kocuria marina]|uniref:nucleotide disphospho-sugar-binding domain-containing protein n=1 Tax=Kocuria marina TaxID=223184 RepID=UPI00384CB42A